MSKRRRWQAGADFGDGGIALFGVTASTEAAAQQKAERLIAEFPTPGKVVVTRIPWRGIRWEARRAFLRQNPPSRA